MVLDAATSALAAARPDPKSVTDHLYAYPRIPPPAPNSELGGEPVLFGEAIRRTLTDVMANDDRVRVFGEDVADGPETILDEVDGIGGVFGTTLGLQRRFGGALCLGQ